MAVERKDILAPYEKKSAFGKTLYNTSRSLRKWRREHPNYFRDQGRNYNY